MKEIISLNNINKYYKIAKEKHQVLKSINFNINEGDFLIIMGKSGSGKTTLLNILGFLDRFDEGSYIFNGKDVSNLSERQRSVFRNENIGFVFQQFNLINGLDVYSNVEMPMVYKGKVKKQDRKAIVKEKLDLVGLGDKIQQFPLQLSGGQQQRVAIARALVNDPQIIFADEPTGALDSDTGIDIMNLLKELNKQGKTIIMVTHDEDLTRYATKIVKLRDGNLVWEASI